ARPTQDIFHLLAPATQEQVQRFAGDDSIKRQQYLDFLECRSYRASVLCRSDVELAPPAGGPAVVVQDLYVAGRIVEQATNDPATGALAWRFSSPTTEATLRLNDARPLA